MRLPQLIKIASAVVEKARRKLPPDIRDAAAALAVLFESAPNRDVLAEGFEPDLLGLFSGNPHDAELVNAQPEPPRIVLYLNNLWDFAEEDPDIFRDEVRLTFLHELGHYLGWDEDEVAARGLQ